MLDGYKTIIGAAVAFAATAAKLAGFDIGDAGGWANDVIALVGSAFAIYGRIVATRRLSGGNLK